MRVWCCTDRPTDQLRANGMLGVSVTIGNSVLKPGDWMDVPSHLIAELRLAFRNGLLTTVPPPAKVETVKVAEPVKPVVEAVKAEPIKAKTVDKTESGESTDSPETPEPDNTEQRRRRR